MSHIVDLGRRVELVPIDSHFHDITIGLYLERQDAEQGVYSVHSYSQLDGTDGRLNHVAQAMVALGGMQRCDGVRPSLVFPCKKLHLAAAKRVFLEACKVPFDAKPTARSSSIFDKKADGTMHVRSEGAGAYRVTCDQDDEKASKRIAAIAGGFAKLLEMERVGDDAICFGCGQPHDVLVNLLLPRALNVRAAMREQEQQAARGVLAAPSAQSL